MRRRDLLAFAAGGLRGHGLRTGLSLLGVAIGVASVVMLTSLGEGARRYVTGEFTSLGSNLLIIIPGKTETFGAAPFVSSAPNDLTVDDAVALQRGLRSVVAAAPVSLGTADVQFGERSRAGTVLGTTHELLSIRKMAMASGRFLPPGTRDAPVCVLGSTLARELFGNTSPLGEVVRIGETRFRVIGVTAPQGTSIGLNVDETVNIPVDAALRLFNRTSLFRILADVSSPELIEEARDGSLALLRERHGGEEDVTVLTQDAVLATFNKILRILTAALAGIAAISLTVAGIGIMNVMLVSVSERTREIGLLKALGATGNQIRNAFLLEAGLISTAGGVAGLAVGFGAARVLLHFFPDFPVSPPAWAVAGAITVAVAVGLVFGGLPARNAARLDPIEALRGGRR